MNDITTINLEPVTTRDGARYGLVLESPTLHKVTGPGLHNRSFPHVVQVWLKRDQPGVVEVHLKAQAVVIAAHASMRDQRTYGPDLAVGEVVALTIGGDYLTWGQHRIVARSLADPALVAVDPTEGV
jgi:hypothetical protein